MKEAEQLAVKDLAEFYQYYVKHGIDESLRKKAREIEQKYLNASPLIPEDVDHALGLLVDFYAETGIMPPSKEKAKKILAMLEKYSD
jgi:hypothetical protein